MDINQDLKELSTLIKSLLPRSATCKSAVPGLTLYRRDNQNIIDIESGQILLSLIVNGSKETQLGSTSYVYSRGQCLLCTVEFPATFHALEPTKGDPFLSASLTVNLQDLIDCAQNAAITPQATAPDRSIFVFDASAFITDAFLRLIKLALSDRDDMIKMISPLIIREIYCLLLFSSCAPQLLFLLSNKSHSLSIAKAANFIKQHHAQKINVSDLAAATNMSVSAFHRRFKALMGTSPIQLQKQIRLHEAYHLIFHEGCKISAAAYQVGYESTSQFIREYKNYFGSTPKNHLKKIKAAAK